MERIFGPVMQNAFVVPDLEGALDHWTRVMGVGPFFVFEHVEFAQAWYRGRDATDIDMTVAIAYWGDLQIELIRQNNAVPSIFTDFPARDSGGLQHMGVVTDSVDRDLARLAPLGVAPLQHGTTSAGLRFAYVSTDRHPGGMIELIESNPRMVKFFEKMRVAAQSWDGAAPIRSLG
jgi:Glyoxalase/Bleomycin resistance protein/Dioxygenase superfamily